jgi:hypothetical protein
VGRFWRTEETQSVLIAKVVPKLCLEKVFF